MAIFNRFLYVYQRVSIQGNNLKQALEEAVIKRPKARIQPAPTSVPSCSPETQDEPKQSI